MRRTALLTLLLFALLPAAGWAREAVLGDGTLSIRSGDGVVRLELERGVAIGRMGSGMLEVIEPRNIDCSTAFVWLDGERAIADERFRTIDGEQRFTCVFKGENLRYRLLGTGGDIIRLNGEDISLSAVGRGRGTIKGRFDGKPDGTWSLNGADYASLPDEREGFRLAAPPPPE